MRSASMSEMVRVDQHKGESVKASALKHTRIEIVSDQIVISLPNRVQQSAQYMRRKTGNAKKHVRLVDVVITKQAF